jgi:levanase/fructan beta-fructosidase
MVTTTFLSVLPDSNVWGPMHWGHAISTDLISWTEKPIALYQMSYIFSGSAVVDVKNTSGLGA